MAPNQDPTQATWFDIWAAGVAINTVCVQHGLAGRVTDLGMFLSRTEDSFTM